MREIKKSISIILPATFGMLLLVSSIVEYVEFLKTWGFSAIDVIFIATALALFFVFLNIQLVDTSKEKPSWVLAIGGLVLIVAWALADWAIFPKDSRLSELIDALWLLIITGTFVGLTNKSWLRHQEVVARNKSS